MKWIPIANVSNDPKSNSQNIKAVTNKNNRKNRKRMMQVAIRCLRSEDYKNWGIRLLLALELTKKRNRK